MTESEHLALEYRQIIGSAGDTTILERPRIALLCSSKCPGHLILDMYELAKQFRQQGVTVISGFHSPLEEECLRILLRSPHPVIWCLARGLFKRIPETPIDCRAAVAEGRLLILSPFQENIVRVTARTALLRNRLVADLANAILIPHAASGSRIETLARELLTEKKPVYTFDHPENAALLDQGAKDIARLELAPFIA